MNGRGVHHASTVALSTLMVLIGIGLVVEALSGDGGALSGRTLLGVLFCAAGVGRFYIERRRRSGA